MVIFLRTHKKKCLSTLVIPGPGVCPSASLVTWVGLQPFPSFSVLLLLRLLAGVGGLCTLCQGAPVAVVSAWFEGEVTLLPFPYLRVGVLLVCGVTGVCGLRRRSRLPFVVRHGLGFVDRVLWPLDGPGTCCFHEPYLAFFPLASSVGCWLEVVEVYPWLSSLRSLAVEGVDLVLYQVLVGLPSWCLLCLWTPGSSGVLLFLLGHLSQVRSVF